MTGPLIRNHRLDDFMHCRYRYRLLHVDGWAPRETDDNLLIGLAVHAALAKWPFIHDEPTTYKAAFDALGPRDDLTDVVYALLSGYFVKHRPEPLEFIATETEFTAPFLPDAPYKGRIDGLAASEGAYWVVERKTSGLAPMTFFRRYALDAQTLGYLWGARCVFDVPIRGIIVDALFKPTSKVPETRYERRRFEPSDATVDRWLLDRMATAKDMQRAHASGDFYRSYACETKYGMCEFQPFCESNDLAVLDLTHQRQEGTDAA